MQSLNRIDFACRRIRVTPVVCVLFAGALIALALIGRDWVRATALGDEVASLQQRLDAREQFADRVWRAELKRVPGERKVAAAVRAQVVAKANGVAPMLAKIGVAWQPRVALLGVSIGRVGKEANITGEAQDLAQVYAFVDRLQAGPSGLRAMLLRHEVKERDPQGAVLFDISVEQQ